MQIFHPGQAKDLMDSIQGHVPLHEVLKASSEVAAG